MRPRHLTSFLEHVRALRAAATPLGVTATITLDDCAVDLQAGTRRRRWAPKFMARVGDRLAYTDVLGDGVAGFAGWVPHSRRRWPEATGKPAFKRAAAERGIATPAACIDPARIGGPFLVKHAQGSFGLGQRGPFLAYDRSDPEQQLGEGEFYENFLPGVIAKAWCWGPDCVALELRRPASVTGDGARTLRALVEALPQADAPPDWLLVERLARYAGLDGLDAVPAAGRELPVDYRYASPLADPMQPSVNRLEAARESGLAAAFEHAAARLQDTLPTGGDPARTLFTLDAIVDPLGEAWFLEMNCNPLVHPDAYPALLADAFPMA